MLMAIWIRVRDKASHNTILECQVQATNTGSIQTLQGSVQTYGLQSGSESETQGWYKHYRSQFKHTGLPSQRQSIPQYSFRMPSTSHQHRVHTDITGVGSNIRTAAWIRVRDTGLVQTLLGSVQTYWTAESETKHPTILFSNDKYKPPTGSQTLQGSVQTYWTAESETKHSTQLLSNYKPPTLGRFKHYTGQQSASESETMHPTLPF